jgi:hypothetical protein
MLKCPARVRFSYLEVMFQRPPCRLPHGMHTATSWDSADSNLRVCTERVPISVVKISRTTAHSVEWRGQHRQWSCWSLAQSEKAQLNLGCCGRVAFGGSRGLPKHTRIGVSRIREFLLLLPSALVPRASAESLKNEAIAPPRPDFVRGNAVRPRNGDDRGAGGHKLRQRSSGSPLRQGLRRARLYR